MKQFSKQQAQRSWAEICCLGCSCLQLFWPRVVIRKWLNLDSKDTEYSADSDDEDDELELELDFDNEEVCPWPRESRFKNTGSKIDEVFGNGNDACPVLRRRKSETFRGQYITTKEIKVCVGTWNVGGKLPPDDLDIDEWLDIREPADIYVVGIQEIVPLNAGNIFGLEDTRPVLKWENIIRETLNRIRPEKTRVKCYSDPPSPSRFKPPDDIPDIEDEIMIETDSEGDDEEVHPVDMELDASEEVNDRKLSTQLTSSSFGDSYGLGKPDLRQSIQSDFEKQYSCPNLSYRLLCTEDNSDDMEATVPQSHGKLTKMLSGSERIGLCWPEPPLPLLSQHVLERPNSMKASKSFKSYKSFKAYNSFKSITNSMQSDISMLTEIDLESLMNRKRKSPYVRIVSKQMVGIFLTVWVRRSLRRYIKNVKVSTVGVGILGYIGNKGSVSVSMSIHQTLFCFICTHLTSGEKDGDETKRNNDVREISQRTQFHSVSNIGLPRNIHDHERIIWFGDLNYRINMPYEKTRELIFKQEWSKLLERDQLARELRKGRTFCGWSEGTLNFPPTYKYEFDSEKYSGEESKAGRRTPSWCDRILSYGKGMKQLSYRRAELRLSDHRPVSATYLAEVEVFCPRKLQRALTFTDAEINNDNVRDEAYIESETSHLRIEEDISDWEQWRSLND